MELKIKNGIMLLSSIYDSLCDLSAYVATWMMFGMAIIITYEITARYFFTRPTVWVSDFTDYIMLYTTFLASAWLLKHDGHVRLTILIEHLSPKAKLIMNVINSSISVIVCGVIFWFVALDSLDALRRNIVVPRPVAIPKYVFLGVISFSFLLLLFGFLRNALRSIRELQVGSQASN